MALIIFWTHNIGGSKVENIFQFICVVYNYYKCWNSYKIYSSIPLKNMSKFSISIISNILISVFGIFNFLTSRMGTIPTYITTNNAEKHLGLKPLLNSVAKSCLMIKVIYPDELTNASGVSVIYKAFYSCSEFALLSFCKLGSKTRNAVFLSQ